MDWFIYDWDLRDEIVNCDFESFCILQEHYYNVLNFKYDKNPLEDRLRFYEQYFSIYIQNHYT